MKKFVNILAIALGVTLIAVMQSWGQNLPSACVGSNEMYWVRGFNGISDFEWKVYYQDGTLVDPSHYTLVGRGDSIQMSWSESLPGGIYTFEVIEHSDYGCTGEPWRQDIVLNSPTINIPFDGVPTNIAICFGDQAALDPGQFQSYLWQDGSTNRIYYTGDAGTYQVRLVNDEYACSYNDIEVNVNPLPVVWLGNDTVLFGDQTLLLDAYGSDIMSYNWSTGDITSSVYVDGRSGNQQVWVTVTDDNTCSASDTIYIAAADYSNMKIPGAFTPNGDGINDTWLFPAPNKDGFDLYPYLNDVDVKIFNRWGKMVWESEGPFKAWDGKDIGGRELPMDSYHYIIRFNVGNDVYTYKGSVTIVR